MIDPDILESMHLVRESARGIAVTDDLSRVRKLRYTQPGFDRSVWRNMCELGWPGLRLPDPDDGSKQSMLLYCALAEELGAGLLPEPLVQATLTAALLPPDELPSHLAGDRLIIAAWQDSRGALEPELPLEIRDSRLYGTKLYVPGAVGADAFLVIGTNSVAIVEANAAGVEIVSNQTQDGGNLATVTFSGCASTFTDLNPQPAFAEAALATSSYLLGIIERSLSITVEYLKTRVQFGKQIGSFQALQHLAVDLKLEAVLTRASIEDAALQWDSNPGSRSAYASISRARARASRAASQVTRNCIQLHGGIGFTDEHDIGLYLRKAMVVASQFGTAAAHTARYASLRPTSREA